MINVRSKREQENNISTYYEFDSWLKLPKYYSMWSNGTEQQRNKLKMFDSGSVRLSNWVITQDDSQWEMWHWFPFRSNA